MRRVAWLATLPLLVVLAGCQDQPAVGSKHLLNFTPAATPGESASPTEPSTAAGPPTQSSQPAVRANQPTQAATAAPRAPAAATPRPAAQPPAYCLLVTARGFTSDCTAQTANPVLHIPAGGRVRVFNKDAVRHTWTAVDGTWDSGQIAPGGSWDYVPPRTGTWSFQDKNNLANTGELQVG